MVSIYFLKYVRVEYSIQDYQFAQDSKCSGLHRVYLFVIMTGFSICVGMQLWTGSEYSKYARFLHMQALHKGLNMAQ